MSALVMLRRLARLVGLIAVLGGCGLEIAWRLHITPEERRRQMRATWIQTMCRRLMRVLQIRASYHGEPAAEGMLVCNHLSYLDVIVLGAHYPMAFIAKSEVRTWPVIGWLTSSGGTLYIDRASKADVFRVGAELSTAVRDGVPVCVFPEGTSSDGSGVLPFLGSLLQPAVAHGWLVTPAHLQYNLPSGGVVADEVCYWRDMTLGPHLLNLLGKNEIIASVRYGVPIAPSRDRKELARMLRAQVIALGENESLAGEVQGKRPPCENMAANTGQAALAA